MTQLRLLPYGEYDPPFNMILDDVLLQRVGRGDSSPTLRLYGWNTPTLSLGRSQSFEILENLSEMQSAGIAVVKRPTGGAVAVHGRDLSYSLALPFPDPLLPKGPKACYCLIHQALVKALGVLGIDVECVTESAGPDYRARVYCGLTLSAYDIVSAGRKVVGSAQRRTAGGFLQHGFLLLNEDFGWVRQWLGQRGEEITQSCRTLAELSSSGSLPDLTVLRSEIEMALAKALHVDIQQSPLSEDELREVDSRLKDAQF